MKAGCAGGSSSVVIIDWVIDSFLSKGEVPSAGRVDIR